MTAPKMTRVAVRVPRTTLDQINAWVDALGVRRSHFLGIALVAGVRSLMRASAFELAWPSLAEAPEADDPSHPDRPPGEAEPPVLSSESLALQAQIARLEAQVSQLQARVASLGSTGDVVALPEAAEPHSGPGPA